MTVTQSTISATFGGVSIINSTLSGNGFTQTGFYAGLIGDDQSTFTLVNTTIVGAPGNITPGTYAYGNAAFHLKNTLIAHHPGGNCAPTPASYVQSSGYNMDTDGTCLLTGTGDQKGTTANPLNPGLDSGLASNGGPTQTIALLAGSQAINAIPVSSCTDDLG